MITYIIINIILDKLSVRDISNFSQISSYYYNIVNINKRYQNYLKYLSQSNTIKGLMRYYIYCIKNNMMDILCYETIYRKVYNFSIEYCKNKSYTVETFNEVYLEQCPYTDFENKCIQDTWIYALKTLCKCGYKDQLAFEIIL